MDNDASRASEADVYAASLDFTLKELQRKVRDYEAEIAQIRSSQATTQPPFSAEDQAIVIKEALMSTNASAPFLPFSGSVLPALLALRRAHQTISESRAYLESQSDQERKQLEWDRNNLRDQRLLTNALEGRIASLREEVRSKAEMRPEDSAREKMEELRDKKREYDRETRRLMATLRDFTDTQLAGMLAAEELGGPVVGDVMEVDPDELAAGFDAQGKTNRPKNNGDGRQRRIDDIWGSRRQQQNARPDGDEEIATAGREMRELLEELLNRLGEARGDNSASYVVLERESAAARFLVRSKVAQFHPKDANRLRLIDFGRELEN